MIGSLILASVYASALADAGRWRPLAPIPDREGFAAPFAGVSHGALLVGGGANFPGKKPWEGGQKAWYDAVHVLERPDGAWKVAGKLRRPLAYGVSLTHRTGVVCIGGSDAVRHYADAFRMVWKEGKLAIEALPPLPTPLANACGALVGDVVYVAGGQSSPDPSDAETGVFAIDLSAAQPKWRREPPCPGEGRILAATAALDGDFWLMGGATLLRQPDGSFVRRYLKDAYRYNPSAGWRKVAALPHPVVAAPSPAPSDATGFWILGGDDGSKVGFQPVQQHPGFPKEALRFDLASGAWRSAGDMPVARVTVPLVPWGRMWVIPNGEARPGVRSPEVWAVEFGSH